MEHHYGQKEYKKGDNIDILGVLEIWLEHLRETGKLQELKSMFAIYKILTRTNANPYYLLNNFCIQTYKSA